MTHRIVRCLIRLWIVLLAVGALARSAQAEDSLLAKLPRVKGAAARARLVSGNAHYRTKEFEAALADYKTGLQLEDAAIFLYNIGQCDRALRRWEDAIWVFQRFLDRAKPEPALAERVEGFLQDAAQQIDNERRAPLREPVDTASPTTGSSGRAPATPPPIVTATASPPPTVRLIAGEPWYRDSLAWGVTGVGVVALGVSGWLLADAGSASDEANHTASEETRQSLYDRRSTRRTQSAIVGGAGLVMAGAGIVMLVVHPRDREERVGTAWHIGLSGNGLAVAGQF